MIKDALKYLEPNACVPIDMATTIMLVNALKEALAQRTAPACPECKAEVLYECVACSSNNYPPQRTEQEADELNIAYMSGLYDGKKKRPWVGLTDEEISAITSKVIGFNSCVGWEEDYARAIMKTLKEKNT
jgi:uncharacterized metal-binding protein